MSKDVIRKIKALLAKAGDEGVTEAEAMSYAEKAAELMAKHGIDPKSVDENTIHEYHQKKRMNEKWWWEIACSTAMMFNCVCLKQKFVRQTTKKNANSAWTRSWGFIFIGRENERITTELMSEFFIGTIMKAGVAYMKKENCTRKVRDEYVAAMARRLSNRIYKMAKKVGDGKQLALINKAIEKDNVKSEKSKELAFTNKAAIEGYYDADKIGLNVQTTGNGEATRITQTLKIGN